MFCFQAEDGIRDLVRSRGLGDVYKRQVLDIDISPDNSLIAVGRKDGFVSIINIAIRQNVYNYNFSKGPVSIVQFRPDGKWLGVGTKTGAIRIWKVLTDTLEVGPVHDLSLIHI